MTRGLLYFPPVETHLLRSAHVAQTFWIAVARPTQRRGEVTRVPAVYVTDGNDVFEEFKSIAWRLQIFGRDVSPFLLVAIGYPGDSPIAGTVLRGRDLTFPGCPERDLKPFLYSLAMEWEGVSRPEQGSKEFYGAEDFQRFLSEELIPFIDEKYPTI